MKKKYFILSLFVLLVFLTPIYLGLNADLIASFKQVILKYDFSVMMISIGVLIFCFVLELIFLGFSKSSIYQILHPNKSVVTDVIIGLAYTLGVFFFAKTFYFLSINQFSLENFNPSSPANPVKITWLYLPKLLMYLIIADLLKYFFHRLSHEFKFLWEIHKFHHGTTSFIILSGNRVHPIEHILQKLFVTLPLVFIGIKVDMYLSIIVITLFIDKLQHSMLDWNYGWIGKYIIFSPIGHRIHHSELQEHWDKNYGDLFVWWDRLFGTYYTGNKVNTTVGVSNNWMNKEGVVYDLWHSVYLSFQAFFQSLKTNTWRGEHLKITKDIPQKKLLKKP